MVHQHGADKAGTAVPEELYNLTQLADVTLAAGKLSTESVSTSTEVIGRSAMSAFTPVRQNFYPFPIVCGSMQNPTICKSHQQNRLSGAISTSSDDDMSTHQNSNGPSFTRNYAHKIFDKRKARNQLITTTPHEIPAVTKSTIENDEAYKSWVDKDRLICPTVCTTMVCVEHAQNNHCPEPMEEGHLSTTMSPSAGDCVEQPNDDEPDGLEMDDEEIDGEHEEVDDEQLEVAEGDDCDIHVCPECGKKYSTSSNLARHRQTHRYLHRSIMIFVFVLLTMIFTLERRSLMDKKARRCPHCDKVYVSMPAFSMHVRTHNQGCECPHCGKRFSRPWLLQGHIRTHTGE